MTNLFKTVCAGLAGGFIAQGLVTAARAADEPFQFKFEANHPLVYAVTTTRQNVSIRVMQLDTGEKSSVTTNKVDLRYKFRLTPLQKSADGVWTLRYEPFGVEEDAETSGTGGRGATTIRGLDVKSTQNGIVVIDTTQDVGTMQAKAVKQGAYARLLSGNFEFQPDGRITKLSGDLPFVDYWTETSRYEIGFFDIVFPAAPVPAGGNWTTNLVVKDLEGIKLGQGGIVETNTFAREATPAATNQLVTITASMAVNPKNIMASMDSMGQNTVLNLSEFNHKKTGQFLFDPAAGCLQSGEEDDDVNMTMNMLLQGHTMAVTTELNIRTKFELLKN